MHLVALFLMADQAWWRRWRNADTSVFGQQAVPDLLHVLTLCIVGFVNMLYNNMPKVV